MELVIRAQRKLFSRSILLLLGAYLTLGLVNSLVVALLPRTSISPFFEESPHLPFLLLSATGILGGAVVGRLAKNWHRVDCAPIAGGAALLHGCIAILGQWRLGALGDLMERLLGFDSGGNLPIPDASARVYALVTQLFTWQMAVGTACFLVSFFVARRFLGKNQ